LATPDTTEEEIRENCRKTHRVEGVSHGHDWQLILVHVNGPVVTEITEAAAWFGSEHPDTLSFFVNDSSLSDYLTKREANYKWLQKGGKAGYLPTPPTILACSHALANEFSLSDIASQIKAEQMDLIKRFGTLPILPSLLAYKNSSPPFKLCIKVCWNGKK